MNRRSPAVDVRRSRAHRQRPRGVAASAVEDEGALQRVVASRSRSMAERLLLRDDSAAPCRQTPARPARSRRSCCVSVVVEPSRPDRVEFGMADVADLKVPRPSFTSNSIGARSTETTSPISLARSAIGPPGLPVIDVEHRLLLRSSVFCVEIERDAEVAVQHVARDVDAIAMSDPPHRCHRSCLCQNARPAWNRRCRCPDPHRSSTGHRTRQSQTSSRRPSR